jgi:general secretion pathway protein E
MSPDPITAPPALAAATIASARALAARDGEPVLRVLERETGIAGDDLVHALGCTLAMGTIGRDELRPEDAAFDALPFTEAAERGCVPIRRGGALSVVYADPFRSDVRAWAHGRISEPFAWRLAHPETIERFFRLLEACTRELDEVVRLAKDGSYPAGSLVSLQHADASEGDRAAMRLLASTLDQALDSGASDIHIEAEPGGVVVKHRVDGVLVAVARPRDAQLASQVVAHLKAKAGLDVAERRVPQNGCLRIEAGRGVELRVSILPGIHGEDAVLRMPTNASTAAEARAPRLDHLGLPMPVALTLRALVSAPHGLVLVTGPARSGKTATAYAAIAQVNNGQDRIVTIEDPVEHALPGVLQVAVDEARGITFARGLDAILGHDPDRILVGEIRDGETARMGAQAALGGRLVIATMRANGVFDAIDRLVDLGIDPRTLAAATEGIVTQRLVRITCRHCDEPHEPGDNLLAASGLDRAQVTGWRLRAGTGCSHCGGSGYRGRRAIAELLRLDDELRERVAKQDSIRALRAAASTKGTRTLRDAALDLVKEGLTTLQEINRVIALA